jgi:hypothetical protein
MCRGVFPGASLLQLIDTGDVSFLRAPPAPYTSQEAETTWVTSQLCQLTLGPRGLLEEALRAYSAEFVDVPEHKRGSAVIADIRQQLGILQFHPALMCEYRRFVVVQDPSEKIRGDEGSVRRAWRGHRIMLIAEMPG